MKREMKQTAVEWLVNMWEMQGTITPLDIKEAKRKEKEIIVDFTIKHSDDKVEKIAYDYDRTFNISDKMKTPIEMLNAIIQMQEANYGRGSDTHMALNELAKEAKEVVKSYTENEK
jgi:hypothetical protein